MIKVENLYKWFGSKLAVEDVSFEVSKGEILGFIGPNGAGKSTTMRIITGFIPASKGKVSVGGYDIDNDAVRAKSLMGYLPENAPLYANMTVYGFLNFAAEIRGFSGTRKKDSIEHAIETCFLNPVRHQTVDTLSKGYKHRTCLAQSIIHDPDVLILDEPTDGLDPNQKREIRNLIKSMSEKKAIILSTHILEEVDAVCSRVLIVDKGRKIFDGTADQMKQRSENAGMFTLEFSSGSPAEIAGRLRMIDGVSRSEADLDVKGAVVIKVMPSKQADRTEVRKRIFEVVKNQELPLTQLKVEEGRLDEVFYAMTRGDAA
ncbi:MAG TPA: ABC transporter ATP-binding protein [Lentisphaeria bacterium]|nr:MAG: ABC transporter ATP-binding protein [Lentisphaerae bacterium GWF2_50_93]HCE44113.1 ABC transporter ATP-binding protein [Lentisphaeria bacterium]